jgi:hypothetical protein
MVASRINSQIEYKETRRVDSEDIGHKTAIYELDVFDRPMVIAIGKPKYTFSSKKVIFYPIYIVNQSNHIDAQIGVFEISQDESLAVFDEDGDIDIDMLGMPIFYGFAEKMLSAYKMKTADYLHEWNKAEDKKITEKTNIDDDEVDDEVENDERIDITDSIIDMTADDDTDDDDVFKMGIPASALSREKTAIKKTLTRGFFETNKNFTVPPALPEETEESVITAKKEYRVSQTHSWIQKFMKNDNYKIHDVESNGDCFFAVVREAYESIGQITTVAKLRAIVADGMTDTIFQEHRQVFLDVDGSVKRNVSEMKKIKGTNSPELKKRAKMAEKRGNKDELKAIIEEGKVVKQRYKDLESDTKVLTDLIGDSVGQLTDIDTIEKFRRFIQTPSYWAGETAIAILEQKLNMKIIIMNEDAFSNNDLTGVLMCSTGSESEETLTSSPQYYIITSLKRKHYTLVSYKNKRILTFSEIPFQIKTLVVNKCMEMNSGAFYRIQDFRDFKTKMGIDPDLGKVSEDDDTGYDYEPGVVLMYYAKSNKSPDPGKGSGEMILPRHIMEMSKLGRPENNDWRRKLTDTWSEANFNIDGHMYASVDHYYEGSKFKSGFPDFALKFSVDSDSDISKDVALAKAAGSITGIMKNKGKSITVRPSSINMDPEFYPDFAKESHLEAVRAKFSQNQDMKNILLSTMSAKLTRYVPNQPAELDNVLMKVRKELNMTTESE